VNSNEIISNIYKIHPDYDPGSQIVLCVIAETYFPYSNKVAGNVEIVTHNKENTLKTKTRRPYPNKHLSQVSAAKGNACCNIGIPLILGVMDLIMLEKVIITWKYEDCATVTEKHDINFDVSPTGNFYCLHSKALTLEAACDTSINFSSESLESYIDEYLSDFESLEMYHPKVDAAGISQLKSASGVDIIPLTKELIVNNRPTYIYRKEHSLKPYTLPSEDLYCIGGRIHANK
jgi:hypothetical protein